MNIWKVSAGFLWEGVYIQRYFRTEDAAQKCAAHIRNRILARDEFFDWVNVTGITIEEEFEG